MKLMVFWIVGTFSLLAGLLAVVHPRPIRCTQGLVGLMAANAILFFLLSTPLLGIELLVVTIGAATIVYFILMRRRMGKLGSPGRLRLNITRFVAFFVAIWLGVLLLWALNHMPASPQNCPPDSLLTAETGAWLALVLLGVAFTTTLLVVVVRRREDEEDPKRTCEGEPG